MKTPQKRTLTPVTDWKRFAWELYLKAYGRRCVVCSKYVDFDDADMYTLAGLNEVILKHETCK